MSALLAAFEQQQNNIAAEYHSLVRAELHHIASHLNKIKDTGFLKNGLETLVLRVYEYVRLGLSYTNNDYYVAPIKKDICHLSYLGMVKALANLHREKNQTIDIEAHPLYEGYEATKRMVNGKVVYEVADFGNESKDIKTVLVIFRTFNEYGTQIVETVDIMPPAEMKSTLTQAASNKAIQSFPTEFYRKSALRRMAKHKLAQAGISAPDFMMDDFVEKKEVPFDAAAARKQALEASK